MNDKKVKIPLLINAEGKAVPLTKEASIAIEKIQYLQELLDAKQNFIGDPKKTTQISKFLGVNRSTLEKNIKKALAGDERAKEKLEDYYDLYIFRKFLKGKK
jgi:DNA invertase Pin-like site-specific DNA recombinase